MNNHPPPLTSKVTSPTLKGSSDRDRFNTVSALQRLAISRRPVSDTLSSYRMISRILRRHEAVRVGRRPALRIMPLEKGASACVFYFCVLERMVKRNIRSSICLSHELAKSTCMVLKRRR